MADRKEISLKKRYNCGKELISHGFGQILIFDRDQITDAQWMKSIRLTGD